MEAYERLRELGRGAYGVVDLIRRKLDGHLFALKRLPLPRDRLSQSLIEVDVLSRLHHSGIVRL